MDMKGIIRNIELPCEDFADHWSKIFIPDEVKSRLLSQAIIEFTMRGELSKTSIPLHGLIMLVGPPGTGKTSLAKGLAHRVAESLNGRKVRFIEVEPHSLTSSALGRSQKAVSDLLQSTIAEHAENGPLIVLLDEVETLAADRHRMSLEANPIDVHRATDAVLASLDLLADKYPNLLFIATSNFKSAIDQALISRADLVEEIDLPTQEACRAIIQDTLTVLAEKWPDVAGLLTCAEFETVVMESEGLDGREIRKAVLSAFTFNKDTAMDPNQLRLDDLLRSIRHKKESKSV